MRNYKKLFFWENIKRTKYLINFKDLIVKYFNNIEASLHNRNSEENNEAIKIRSQINHLVRKASIFIYESDISASITYFPPPITGRSPFRIDLLEGIFNLDSFEIPHQNLLDLIERSIGIYESDKTNSLIRTINPFFWIYLAIDFLASVPFKILEIAGFNAKETENSLVGKIVKSAIGFIIVFAAFLTVLEKLGWLENFKSILKRFIKN